MQIFKYILIGIALIGNGALSASAQTECCSAKTECCSAQDEAQAVRRERPTLKTNAMMIGVGATNMLDTYLSPEKYRGVDIRFLSHTRREKDSTVWINQFQHEGNVAYADNRSGNGGEMAGGYTFRYSLLRKWNVSLWSHPLQLIAGGTAAANIGMIYNTRNGNNPANARLSLHIEPTVGFDYPIGRPSSKHGIAFRSSDNAHYPVVLHYEASAPLYGLMFSPNYGQSYYEIFNRGNYDHN